MVEQWYWDLNHHRAVRADERGPADHVLGPYATRGEAENWQQRVDERNEAWDDEDAKWNSWGDGDGGGDGAARAADDDEEEEEEDEEEEPPSGPQARK